MNKIEFLTDPSDLRDCFDENGYCAVRDVFALEDLAKLRSDLIELAFVLEHITPPVVTSESSSGSNVGRTSLDSILTRFENNNRGRLHEYQIAASSLASLYSLIPEADKYARHLYSKTSHPASYLKGLGLVLGLPQTRRLSYGWHQDSSYHPRLVADNLVHIWFPIFRPATLANGTMSFLRGSHKLGQLVFSQIKLEDGGYTTRLPINFEKLTEDFEEVSVEIFPGDCVFFHSHLVHKSNANMSDSARIAAVMKFTSEPIVTVEPVLVGV